MILVQTPYVTEQNPHTVQDTTRHITYCTGTNFSGVWVTEIDACTFIKQTYFNIGSILFFF